VFHETGVDRGILLEDFALQLSTADSRERKLEIAQQRNLGADQSKS
jgi:hypothetical protein